MLVFIVLLGALVLQVINLGIDYYQVRVEEKAELQAKEDFIQKLVPTAQRLQSEYGILASVSIGQACLESDFGRSQLAYEYNNLYGVKTYPGDPDGVDFKTSEYQDDEWVEITDWFKAYQSWDESMTKHAELLYYGTDWNPDLYKHVLEADDYKKQAHELGVSAYATDPTYGDKIIAMIETWSLNQYDQIPDEATS